MSKFNLNQLLGGGKPAASKDDNSQSYKITFIPVDELEPSEDNFYSVEQIEELKASIAAFGIKQNLVVTPLDNGKYRVIAGHRRRLAALALVEEGKKEFEKVPCMIETEKDELQERLLLITTNSTARQLSDWEKIQQAKEMKSILEQIKKRDKIPGRLRDLIASVLDTSPTQIARMESIDKNLTPAFKEELREGNVNISTAYELSTMPQEQQQEAYEEYQAKGSMSIKDAKQAKQVAPIVEEVPAARQSAIEQPKQEEEADNIAGCTDQADQEKYDVNHADVDPASEQGDKTELIVAQSKPSKIHHGKWTREEVWIYRNERGDIMRAQDEHPMQAIKDAERILKASRGLM
ncbi:hypothetical protein J40TS1_34260 [Paenibacillus montaniterrae]|uniref:ParB-like N-terminal domain-containing protein n=1 Tax=Paenibacillus montaniterrae TaxID=429341 RepID=A0A920D0A4_9BACL|nr:ParB/RepB/Spo0J family partition protein [Paenibacillus montaniterrae]GIP17784.1 hypothetical protein J40TS1_34260 [Paenibacillus montaniterrae]